MANLASMVVSFKIENDQFRIEQVVVNFEGLGLGLYISYQIFQKHKGEFGIESELKKGTKIWFVLPKEQ